MKELKGAYKELYSLLPKGNKRPVTIKWLANQLGLSIREVHELAYNLIVKYGVPVCGSRHQPNAGIFIARNKQESAQSLFQLRRQLKTTQKRVDALENVDYNIIAMYDSQINE